MSPRFKALVLVASLLFLSLLSFLYYQAQTKNHVVINEFELNPPGEDKGKEWVELYNPTLFQVNLRGWSLQTTAGKTVTVPIPGDVCLGQGGSHVVTYPELWLDNENEMIILFDATGHEVDRTPVKSDADSDNYSWQRVPDGTENWVFQPSTQYTNTVPCGINWQWIAVIVGIVAAGIGIATAIWKLIEYLRRRRSDHKPGVPTQSLMALTC